MFQKLTYLYEEGNTDASWPARQPMDKFLGSSGPQVLQERVQKVYDMLKLDINNLMTSIQENREKVKRAVNKIQSELEHYKESHQIDADFIR